MATIPADTPSFDEIGWTTLGDETLVLIKNIYFDAKTLLSYVLRGGLGDFPDHGLNHSLRVAKIIDIIMEQCSCEFNKYEKVSLYISALFHDIGCVRDRRGHAKESIVVIEKIMDPHLISYYPEETLKECIEWIIKTHSRHHGDNIHDAPSELNYHGVRLRAKLLCAIFRLADSLDSTTVRCHKMVYRAIKDKMNGKSTMEWEAHINVQYINLIREEGKIEINVTDEIKAKSLIGNLIEEMKEIKDILEGVFPCLKIIVSEKSEEP